MTDAGQATGRTLWDFLSELLRLFYRIGPSTIVVGGFLLFGYFFYDQVKKAQTTADTQVQKRLEFAQEQLISTYDKMGGMSEQLIVNIESLLALNSTIDEEIEKSRQQLKLIETTSDRDLRAARAAIKKAEEAKKEADVARAKSEHALRESTERRFALNNERKELMIEISRLKTEKERLQKHVAENASRIASQQKTIDRLEQTPGKRSDRGEDLEREKIRQLLQGHAISTTKYNERDFRKLIGAKVSTFRKVLEQEGLGYELWVSAEDGSYTGFLEGDDYGYGGGVQVSTFGRESIAKVDVAKGIFVVQLPRAENWYQTWTAWTVLMDGQAHSDYESREIEKWDVVELGRVGGMDVLTVLAGKIRTFKLLTPSQFASRHPDAFQSWSRRMDEFGRPSLILRMLHRADNYTANSVSWIQNKELPPDLRRVLGNILTSSVMRTTEQFARHLGSTIDESDLGVLAAMALRDGPRIVDWESEDASEVNGGVATWDIMVAVEGMEKDAHKEVFRLVFENNQVASSWKMIGVTRTTL